MDNTLPLLQMPFQENKTVQINNDHTGLRLCFFSIQYKISMITHYLL